MILKGVGGESGSKTRRRTLWSCLLHLMYNNMYKLPCNMQCKKCNSFVVSSKASSGIEGHHLPPMAGWATTTFAIHQRPNQEVWRKRALSMSLQPLAVDTGRSWYPWNRVSQLPWYTWGVISTDEIHIFPLILGILLSASWNSNVTVWWGQKQGWHEKGPLPPNLFVSPLLNGIRR